MFFSNSIHKAKDEMGNQVPMYGGFFVLMATYFNDKLEDLLLSAEVYIICAIFSVKGQIIVAHTYMH